MRVLTYNIQAAIGAQRATDYVTRGHRQFLNVKAKTKTLDNIAEFMKDFDIVCLQEVDLGGRRSGFKSQIDRLKKRSGLEHSIDQTNRVVGKTSIHGNAILSRFEISQYGDHKLPSRIPGRGALSCHINGLNVINTHLSLNPKTQTEQLSFLKDLIKPEAPVIIVGDLNCRSSAAHLKSFAERAHLNILTRPTDKTYPAWRPRQDLDHIIASKIFARCQPIVHDVSFSDHRPVSINLDPSAKQES